MSNLYQLHTLTAQAGGTPLFHFLSARLPGLSRTLARRAVEAGLVEVDGQPWTRPADPLPDRTATVRCDFRQGIRPHSRLAGESAGAPLFQVLHHDQDLVIVDKAAGALTVPSTRGERGHVQEGLYSWLRRQGQAARWIGMVHRLDKETSGCLCFALNRQAQRLLTDQFASHAAGRVYCCLVHGGPRQERDTLTGQLGRGPDGRRAVVPRGQPGKSAVTHFQVLSRFPAAAELEVRLETGRTHQIRVHLAYIGCPILGDELYGPPHPDPRLPWPGRLMLHARDLTLDHPRTGARLTFTAPLPAGYQHLRRLLAGEPPAAR